MDNTNNTYWQTAISHVEIKTNFTQNEVQIENLCQTTVKLNVTMHQYSWKKNYIMINQSVSSLEQHEITQNRPLCDILHPLGTVYLEFYTTLTRKNREMTLLTL